MNRSIIAILLALPTVLSLSTSLSAISKERYSITAPEIDSGTSRVSNKAEQVSVQRDGMTVHYVRKGNDVGKDMTMEEAVLSRIVHPERASFRWFGNNVIGIRQAGKTTFYDIKTGTESDSLSSDTEAIEAAASISVIDKIIKGLPEGAANPTPSPTGHKVAYTLDHSLYYCDSNGISYPIAVSEDTNISYGTSVSRNEFGISGGIFWSPDGKKVAFYRKDESLVSTFPLVDISKGNGTLQEIKYPMNGQASENVRLGVYDLASASTVYMQADDFGYDQYLTGISWSQDSRLVYIQVLDRSQKHLRLNVYQAATGSFSKTVLSEDNDKYVEPLDPLYMIPGTDKFIYRTDNRDGYRNLYLCDNNGIIERLTECSADVKFAGITEERIFYTSAEISPVENHLFSISYTKTRNGSLKLGSPTRLTEENGWHNAAISPDGKVFVDYYSSMTIPFNAVLKSTEGKTITTLREAPDPLKGYRTGEIRLGTVRSADGQYDNWFRLILPAGFDPEKKYPVILYVYGGPHSQLVRDSWAAEIRMWEMYMAERGYIVYIQDNRGTENRGSAYEKAIHRHCGQNEMADQIAGLQNVLDMPFADKDKVGVHGWSYGGFMTISLMTDFPDLFKVGVAGGPVIDWKWYEVMYGERYMDTQKTNPDGFATTNLLDKASKLKGKLLICQGALDNTVVWEHSLNFVRKCIENQIQVDYFPYPLAEHNVFGRDRIHLMDKVTLYFKDNL